ncbi:hypothetical protein [Blastopirellula marina]|uniref:ATP-grasp domain-containing protein n=1 Tax=Blastopirellula marina TaxID=124 RepID=A0A2S8GBC1_9BACT|nr:hypothetical protein [Blastopirellula marina]PQO41610.1 hypothetical protein C5Y93_31380 [Blastopirellula marina]
MSKRVCLIGLDEPQNRWFQSQIEGPVVTYETLPRMLVQDGQLFVEASSGFGMTPIAKVVFHGIFEDDHDLIAGLALWGGPCLPNAAAMMDCRLKLPCLVRALQFTQFGAPARGYASAGVECSSETKRVAKWGNWHCGENKRQFIGGWRSEESAIVEPFLAGDAVRVVVIGDQFWQIKLEGDDWLKSIHHSTAKLKEADPRLVSDTRRVAAGFGLEIAANDYIVTADGVPHLLEVNHIPNVTRFPEIWDAYAQFVLKWLSCAETESAR